MNLKRYLELIGEFAAADPDLRHDPKDNPALFSMDPEETVALLGRITDRMVLIVPPYGKGVKDNAAMGNVWLKRGLVIALQHVQVDNEEMQIDIQSKAEEVLDRLYAFFFNKRNTPELYGFDPKGWECDDIGPVGTNAYGYSAEFVIKDGVVL